MYNVWTERMLTKAHTSHSCTIHLWRAYLLFSLRKSATFENFGNDPIYYMVGIEGGAGSHTALPLPFNRSTHMGARFLFHIYLLL